MATLIHNDESTRLHYLAWQIQLMRRGLKLQDEAEIEGDDADCLRGEAWCRHVSGLGYEVDDSGREVGNYWTLQSRIAYEF